VLIPPPSMGLKALSQDKKNMENTQTSKMVERYCALAIGILFLLLGLAVFTSAVVSWQHQLLFLPGQLLIIFSLIFFSVLCPKL
jgi:hypothetical protein